MTEILFSKIALPACGFALFTLLGYAVFRLARGTRFDKQGSSFFVYFGLMAGAGLCLGLGLLVLYMRHRVGAGGI